VVHGCTLAARVLGAIAVIVPAFVLIGWVLRVPVMVSIIPGFVAMNPVVATSLALCGFSLLIQTGGSDVARRWARLAGVLVAVIAGVKLLGFVTGHDTMVDELLFRGRLDLVPGLPPKRMSPNSALVLLLLGAALSMLDITTNRGVRPSELLAIPAGLIALLALVGYLYDVTSLYHVKTFIPMSMHTAFVADALVVGILCARPLAGMMATVTSDTVGGETARKLLPAAIVVPIALGWFRVLAERAGFGDVAFGIAIVILGDILFFVVLILFTSRLLRRADVHRRNSEAQISKEKNLLRSLIDNIPDSIFIKDAGGHYIACNLAHAQFAGMAHPAEIVGKTVFDLHPPEIAKTYNEYDRAVMDSGLKLAGREEYITDSHGEPQWAEVSKIPVFDEHNAVIAMVGITRNVTRRKKAEIEREAAQEKLRDQNAQLQAMAASERQAHEALKLAQSQMVQTEKLAALGQLVAGVAHEINNPLSFVSNNIAVLQRDVKAIRSLLEMYQRTDAVVQAAMPELIAEIRELGEKIDLPYTMENLDDLMLRSRDGLRRIQQIVKDLRDFARLDESDLHEVDLNQGVESTVNIIRGRAKSGQVAIELDLHPLPEVTCFPAKINQVVMNLVANAIDACPPNGTVTIRTSAIEADVCVEVIDTGSGIEPKNLERIFDPFFTTKPQGAGTGLGLSISYGIIRDHGGTIEVHSTPGQGSRFSVKLPLRAAMPKQNRSLKA
jgi:PAS domain S-box-containing protein